MAVRQRPKLTYEDYVLFPDDGKQREIIDGDVFVTPSPSTRHQRLLQRLYLLFGNHLETQPAAGETFIAPFDVLLSEFDIVQPDLIFVAKEDLDILTEKNLKGSPTLAVEVVSDPARDRRLKRDLYARAGIREYWIVDPDSDRVEVYRLKEGTYGKPEILEPGESLTTDLLPGLAVDLNKLLER